MASSPSSARSRPTGRAQATMTDWERDETLVAGTAPSYRQDRLP
ncbi:hypothetical protein [Streptomyces sp. NPDC005890]